MMHRIRNALLRFLAIGACLTPVWSSAGTLVITDSNDGVHGAVAEAIGQILAARNTDFQIQEVTGETRATTSEPGSEDIDSIITVGSAAVEWLAQNDWDVPSLSLLTTREQFLGHFDRSDDHHSIVYLNQPLERIIDVGQQIVGNNVHFVIFDHHRSAAKTERLLGSQVTYSPLADNSIIRSIRQLDKNQRHVIIALPSHTAFTPITIKNTLISAYKARIPIIGYSRSFTRAGALFSVHADLDALALEAENWIESGYKAQHRASRYYYVTTNPQIANALGIKLSPPWSREKIRLEAAP